MGRWSRHPMGSDGALDARDGFMERFDIKKLNDETVYFFERPREEVRDGLLSLTLSEIKEMAEKYWYVSNNKFAIPYTFVEWKAYPTDPEIKAYLKECLDSHDDLTGPHNYCNGDEMAYIKVFKDNFEDIISGKKDIEEDSGLLAAIADAVTQGKKGLINLTSDDD